MVSAVVLATYLPSRRSLAILIETLDYLEQHFGDCDIYVGINPSPYVSLGIELLRKSSLNFRYIEAPAHLDTRSDASAFQAAMLIMKQSQASYDLVYFMHLKGSSLTAEYEAVSASGDKVEFNIFKRLLDVFRDRTYVENVFQSEPYTGTYSYLLAKKSNPIPDLTSAFMDFSLPPFPPYLHYYTFYAVRGSALEQVIDELSNDFWGMNLFKISDRYFFELHFPQMIWRQGFLPRCETLVSFNVDDYPIDNETFEKDCANYLGASHGAPAE